MFGSTFDTVDDLIEALEPYRGKKLRAAVQPSYPMGASVVGVAVKEPEDTSYLDADEDEPEQDENVGSVYVVISDHEDYSATREMWNAW